MSPITTSAPAAASTPAIASPRPVAAPVTERDLAVERQQLTDGVVHRADW